MIHYLPEYYQKSEVFIQLLQSFTDEINANNYAISDLEGQLFVDTATWGLSVWEKELGVYTDVSKPYSERREAIKAKMRGSGTCSIQMIKNAALAYTNAEVEVIEDNPNYAFVVKFVSTKGIPPNEKDFTNTIDTIKPAHLAYTVEYTYTVWRELKTKTWGDVKQNTWGEVLTV